MANLSMHSEPDAVINLIGDAHYEAGRLIVGDADVAEKLAAALGVLRGGSQFGHLQCVFTKITVDVVTSSQTFSGKFAEASEP